MSPHLFSFNFSAIYKSDRNNKSTKIKLKTKTETEIEERTTTIATSLSI